MVTANGSGTRTPSPMRHRTRPVAPKDLRRLARILEVMLREFTPEPEWHWYRNKGSITIRRRNDSHSVITIFIDRKNRLANRLPMAIHHDPAAIAIELTGLTSFVAAAARDRLAQMSHYYADPREGYPQVTLGPAYTPDEEHRFDILFLQQGRCPYEMDEREYVRILRQLEEEFGFEAEYDEMDEDQEGYAIEVPGKHDPRPDIRPMIFLTPQG